MALKATVYKATLNLADMDRGYYQEHSLTLAQHPSETDERLLIRLLAFAFNADERLEFTRGLSADDEPELWAKELTGDIAQWIELGLPDEKRIRKACNRADHVIVYAYGGRAAEIWWEGIKSQLTRFANLTVLNLPSEATTALAGLAERTMNWQVSIQDGHAWISSERGNVEVAPSIWQRPD